MAIYDLTYLMNRMSSSNSDPTAIVRPHFSKVLLELSTAEGQTVQPNDFVSCEVVYDLNGVPATQTEILIKDSRLVAFNSVSISAGELVLGTESSIQFSDMGVYDEVSNPSPDTNYFFQVRHNSMQYGNDKVNFIFMSNTSTSGMVSMNGLVSLGVPDANMIILSMPLAMGGVYVEPSVYDVTSKLNSYLGGFSTQLRFDNVQVALWTANNQVVTTSDIAYGICEYSVFSGGSWVPATVVIPSTYMLENLSVVGGDLIVSNSATSAFHISNMDGFLFDLSDTSGSFALDCGSMGQNPSLMTGSIAVTETFPFALGSLVVSGIDLDSTSVVLVGGKALAEVSVDPTVDEVTYNGQPLPTGSVLRNTTNTQKFVKIAGDSKAFTPIEITPKVAWDFTAGGVSAWAYLQGK